jgi:hypothetical protein
MAGRETVVLDRSPIGAIMQAAALVLMSAAVCAS